MKKSLLFFCLAGVTLVSAHERQPVSRAKIAAATCIGADPCKACTNCKYCQRCAKGGKTCGVCKK